jgi:DNA-binding response OmpR family regulator
MAPTRAPPREAGLWLFDYHLDDGDTGIALYARLAAVHGPRPTVILSADTGSDTREAVREAGLSLLNKPFKPLALRWAINHLLAARATGEDDGATGGHG